MITPRENLLRVYRHEQPEWIPAFAGCDNYNQPSRKGMPEQLAGQLGNVGSWCDPAHIHLNRWLGLDIFSPVRSPLTSRTPNCATRNETKGNEQHNAAS